jgi:hypothetical protein
MSKRVTACCKIIMMMLYNNALLRDAPKYASKSSTTLKIWHKKVGPSWLSQGRLHSPTPRIYRTHILSEELNFLEFKSFECVEKSRACDVWQTTYTFLYDPPPPSCLLAAGEVRAHCIFFLSIDWKRVFEAILQRTIQPRVVWEPYAWHWACALWVIL